MYLLELKRDGEMVYDGAVALAAQVYAQKHLHLGEPILFPYFCDPVLQVGRFQNAMEEINMPYAKEHDIDIVRRATGGGTIYIDRGSANLCFLTDTETNDIFSSYSKMYEPVLKAFKEIGLENVEKTGRNDLVLDGKKISGAAMTMVDDRVYGGFSMLLDVDYETLVKSLNPNEKKIISKGIKSVKSRVNEIRPNLPEKYQDLSPEEFCYLIIEHMFDLDSIDDLKRYELTEEDWKNIDELCEKQYKNWDWNFGKSPRFEYNKDGRTSAGTVDITLKVNKGRIEECRIYGDFFAKGEISDVEEALTGSRLREDELKEALSTIDLDNYMKNIEEKELLNLILD